MNDRQADVADFVFIVSAVLAGSLLGGFAVAIAALGMAGGVVAVIRYRDGAAEGCSS